MKMKRLISMLLALMMACLLLPALAEEDYSGDWYLSDVAGTNPAGMGLSMTMTLNADGTVKVTMTMGGEPQEQEGTWVLEDDKITVTIDDTPQVFTIVEGTLQADMGGAIGTFTREPAEATAIEFADVNPDALAEDYNGSWKATYMSAMGMTLSIDSAIAMGQMSEIPMMTMEDGKLSLQDGGMGLGTILGEGFDLTFADGKYSYSIEVGDVSMSIDLEMLLDGTLRLSVNVGQEIALYFAKAE